MDKNSDGIGCTMGCWLAALVAGILVAALLMIVGGFSFTPAAFFGLLLFVLLGAFLSYAICGGSNAKLGEGAAIGAAGAAAAGAGVAASGATSTATASPSEAAAPATGTASATGSAAASASGDAVVSGGAASASVASAGVKANTTLAGEEELAGRKGEWKYDGDGQAAAEKPAKKKPAAKKPAAKEAAPKKPAAKKSEAKPVAKDGKPELLKKARAGGPDDLKQIKGVGPKMEGMLHDMGVFHFDQVASWRKAEVQWVDDNLDGFNGRVSRDEWVKQAKILAKGGTTEFSKKVDKGGVY